MTKLLLSRDAILKQAALPSEDVPVPEWGGTVRVRALTGEERDQFEASIVEQKGKGKAQFNPRNMRAKLVSLTVVDEQGKRLFTSADVEALGKLNAAPLDRVFSVAQRLSGLSKEDVEELEGNSEPGRSDGSTSD